MAPKGQKRNATENKKASGSKKVRTEVADIATTEDPVMSAIVETIEKAEKISQNCRNMLVAGVRGSLNTTLDQRHEVQSKVVRMVEEIIAARQASLQECLDEATATEARLEKEKIELTTRLSAAEVALTEKSNLVDDKKLANSAAQEKVTSVKADLVEKEAAQKAGDLVMQEKQQNKGLIEQAINTDLKALIEGEEEEVRNRSCKDILTLISPLNFDESLIKALPGTCVVPPAKRGAFDSMVLNQLDSSLRDTLAEFAKAADAEACAVKERADAVLSATAAVEGAVAAQEKAQYEQSSAEAARVEASACVDTIKAELAAHERQQSDAVAAREGHTLALDAFQKTTRSPFELIKNATTPAAAAESEAATAPIIDAASSPQPQELAAEQEAKVASPEVKANSPEAKAGSPEAKAKSSEAALDNGVATAAGA